MKILVVEDNQTIRIAYVLLLREHKHDVDYAADGSQALKLAKKPYDLILTDIFIPHVNGIDLTSELRRQHKYRQPIIIGITSDTNPHRHQMCLDSGMNDVFHKNIGLNGILAIVEKYSSATNCQAKLSCA